MALTIHYIATIAVLLIAQLSTAQWQYSIAGGGMVGVLLVRPSASHPWGTVCDDHFSNVEAVVACKSLGISYPDATFTTDHLATQSGTTIYMDDVDCASTAVATLAECSFRTNHDCSHHEDVTILCGPNPANWELRLAGSTVKGRGRLEFRPDSTADWGTVCDDGFNNRAALAACRSLGYNGRYAYPIQSFGGGSGVIYLDGITCSATAKYLQSCRFIYSTAYYVGHDCVHSEDVGVKCRGTPSQSMSKSPQATKSKPLTDSKTLSVTDMNIASLTITRTMALTASVTRSQRTKSTTRSQTGSASLSATVTLSSSSSYSFSPSHSQSTSVSRSRSKSLSASQSKSLSASQSKSLSASQSISRSQISPSESTSISSSGTLSETNSAMYSFTFTKKNTASASVSFTCRDLDDLPINDTCTVLRPLPVDWLPPQPSLINNETEKLPTAVTLPAGWRYTAGACTSIRIPFSTWTGRQGAIHTFGIVAVDTRVPLRSEMELPVMGGSDLVSPETPKLVILPITLIFTSVEEAFNLTGGSWKPLTPVPNATASINLTSTYMVAVVTMRYTGKPTLNKVEYTFNGRSWARCPIAMPGEFEVTLEASERLFPPELAEALRAGGGVLSVGGGLTMSPTAVTQMGVATSLQKMTRCAAIDLSDESEDGSYDSYKNGAQNPFGIVIGGGGGRKHIRGALVMSFVYLVGLSLLMFLATTLNTRLSRYLALNNKPLPPIWSGYPSVLMAVAAFVMDNATGAGTKLLVYGENMVDKAIGAFVIVLCLLYISHIFFFTLPRFPPALVSKQHIEDIPAEVMEKEEQGPQLAFSDRKKVLKALRRTLRWLGSETDKWIVDNEYEEGSETKNASAALAWLARHENYIAGLRLRWYCGLEQGVAFAVCLLGALSFEEMTFCVARCTMCTLILGSQATVVIVKRPMVIRWRWILVSVLLTTQTLSSALSIANVILQEQRIEYAMDIMGSTVFLLLGAASLIDILTVFSELCLAARHVLVTYLEKRRLKRKNKTFDDDVCLEDLIPPTKGKDDFPSPLLPPPSTIDQTEQAIVQTILLQLADYNERLEL